MKPLTFPKSALAILALSLPAVANATLPAGWSCTGNCDTFTTADGVVTLPPGGHTSYQWISTNGGLTGEGVLPVGSTGQETNGSSMHTPVFSVSAGDVLDFYFNYITSDGAQYTEYAWAGLFQGASSFDSYLFTARTTPSGNTVPGFGLPGLGTGVTLTPATTAIIAGGPAFSPLGADSGQCFDSGCGYTGWINMSYTFTSGGNYSLGFGVTNALDTAFDTAFAVAGVAINNVVIDDLPPSNQVPLPGTLALMGLGLLGLGYRRRRQTNA